ncbi:hypothetical protein GGS23DRAFT_555230 [Durotheca rogersii]|uniref:uncharacterized protein n=1 Tax=Durotheca rogersii TaxID=419775 RepID=UPI00221ECC1C|nr:uncharacterized protein GGS23DRAFT_555230 [Durotheca rogersii]KAI5866041.1 hypothetical protein GGS23DRAFT_555230 [Durotheca rogersii]
MSLVSIPVEIITDIFCLVDSLEARTYGDYQRSNLCALALTCRYLSEVAGALLYERVSFGFGVLDRFLTEDVKRIKHLNRSFRNRPSLVDRIHSADLHFPFTGAGSITYKEFLRHLSRSSSLTSLMTELGFASWNHLEALYKCEEGGFPNLKTLNIELLGGTQWDQNELPVEKLASICELPSLETIVVRASIELPSEKPVSTTPFPNLKRLHFGFQPVYVEVLQTLMSRAPGLTSLRLPIPGESFQCIMKNPDKPHVDGYSMHGIMSPEFYGTLFLPVASSLTDLVLNTDHVFFTHDGSVIDLSRLVNLTSLTLSSYLLFGSGHLAADDPRAQGVWESLPACLTELHLRFPGTMGLFWPLDVVQARAASDTFGERWEERLNTDHVAWLLDLLDKTRDRKLALKSITISEGSAIDSEPVWQIVQWHMTDLLRKAAREASVNLVIRLRVPLTFDSTEFDVWKIPQRRDLRI